MQVSKKGAGKGLGKWMRRYLPAEVVPLVVPVCLVCGFGAYMGFRTLTSAPDVHVLGTKPRYESDNVRKDPHFAGIHTKAEKYDPDYQGDQKQEEKKKT